jgi:hypothetical protein
MDPISIVAIISGLSGLTVAIFSGLKHSQCCAGFCSLSTRTPPVSPISPTPQKRHSLSVPNSPTLPRKTSPTPNQNSPPRRSSLSNPNSPPRRSSLSNPNSPPRRSSLSNPNSPPRRYSLSMSEDTV